MKQLSYFSFKMVSALVREENFHAGICAANRGQGPQLNSHYTLRHCWFSAILYRDFLFMGALWKFSPFWNLRITLLFNKVTRQAGQFRACDFRNDLIHLDVWKISLCLPKDFQLQKHFHVECLVSVLVLHGWGESLKEWSAAKWNFLSLNRSLYNQFQLWKDRII